MSYDSRHPAGRAGTHPSGRAGRRPYSSRPGSTRSTFGIIDPPSELGPPDEPDEPDEPDDKDD